VAATCFCWRALSRNTRRSCRLCLNHIQQRGNEYSTFFSKMCFCKHSHHVHKGQPCDTFTVFLCDSNSVCCCFSGRRRLLICMFRCRRKLTWAGRCQRESVRHNFNQIPAADDDHFDFLPVESPLCHFWTRLGASPTFFTSCL